MAYGFKIENEYDEIYSRDEGWKTVLKGQNIIVYNTQNNEIICSAEDSVNAKAIINELNMIDRLAKHQKEEMIKKEAENKKLNATLNKIDDELFGPRVRIYTNCYTKKDWRNQVITKINELKKVNKENYDKKNNYIIKNLEDYVSEDLFNLLKEIEHELNCIHGLEVFDNKGIVIDEDDVLDFKNLLNKINKEINKLKPINCTHLYGHYDASIKSNSNMKTEDENLYLKIKDAISKFRIEKLNNEIKELKLKIKDMEKDFQKQQEFIIKGHLND